MTKLFVNRPRSASPSPRFFAALLIGLVLSFPVDTARAQAAVTWEAPTNLSNTRTNSQSPALVADPYGMIHVFWGENLDETTTYPNAIMYTRWDGQSWSRPNDILLAPEGIRARAGLPSAAVGKAGELYLVFAGGWGDSIYFSAARAWEAEQAGAWRKPVLLNRSMADVDEPRIVVDSEGILHVLFRVPIGEEQGIYYVQSQDTGNTWTAPQKIPQSQLSLDTSVFDTRIAVDSSDSLHAVWSWAGYPETYPPKGIWYSRSNDKGESWSLPVLLADGPFKDPYLVTQADGVVHLFWSGTQAQRFKFHSSSADGGLTWSQPWVFPGLGGLQGSAGAAEDSSGVLHAVMATNYAGEVPEVLVHSRWYGQQWSEPEIILRDTHGFGIIDDCLVYAAMAVTEGNNLHVVVQYPVVRVPVSDQQKDIVYLRGNTGAPSVELEAAPTNCPEASPTVRPTDALPAAASPGVSELSQVPWRVEPDSQPTRGSLSSEYAIGVGLGAMLLVLLLVVLGQWLQRR